MAPDPRCSALAAAKDTKGAHRPWALSAALELNIHTGLSYTQIAEKMGKPESHVVASACFQLSRTRLR
jgi:hypothetical protein